MRENRSVTGGWRAFAWVATMITGLVSIAQAAFVEEGGLVVIEAESASSLPGAWRRGPGGGVTSPDIDAAASATGSGFIVWEGSQSLGSPGTGEFAYDVRIQNPGEYRFRWRNQVGRGSNTTEHNDTWLKVEADAYFGRKGNGSVVCPRGFDPAANDCTGGVPEGSGTGGWFKVYSSGANSWSFSTRTSDNDAHDIFARFDSPGVYRVRLAARSSSHVIDRIVLDSAMFEGNATNLALPESAQDDDPAPAGATITGDRRQWHKVSLTFEGPESSETASPNPFLDYRLDVTFSQGGRSLTVPGYFAGDGDGGAAGDRWRVHFAPPAMGTWTYVTSFRSGSNVAVDDDPAAGTAIAFDGASGSFEVSASTRSLPDFRAPDGGLIANRGGLYLTYASGATWVKGGPDVPENFLGYDGFDNTPNAGHSYAAHAGDWRAGDPDFNGGEGRRIIGALNYIASRGANVIYFLPMNIGGDGKDTFPTIAPQEKTRYDLSKLAQWEIVLAHAQSLGIFLHFVLAETEAANENYHDGGNLGPERKLYYRMLIARFGHHNGLQFNIGEENDYGAARHRSFAAFIKAVDPYDHPVTTHTKSGQYDNFYNPLLGNGDFDMTSFQGGNSRTSMFDLIQTWRSRSIDAGVPWAISFDEPQKIENDVDDDASGYPHGRRDKLWPVYMAGGAGFEWYVQQDGGGHSFDQQIDDFGLMGEALAWTGHALDFLAMLPLREMSSSDSLASSSRGGNSYALIKPGEVYAVYNDRNGGELVLDLPAGQYEVKWFDPRNGGALLDGTVPQVAGGSSVSLGESPNSRGDDWAVRVRRVSGDGNAPPAVTITAPVAGAAFDEPATIVAAATASDSDGSIAEVEFFIDGSSVGVDTTAPYEATLTDVAAGTYLLTAVAVDDDDATGSASRTLTVATPDGSGPAVVGFVLVDAQVDSDLPAISDGAVIDLSTTGSALNIRAEVSGTVGSVAFELRGPGGLLYDQTENVAPYAMAGDSSGDYNIWTAAPGTYDLSVTPYSGGNRGGDAGEQTVIAFSLAEAIDNIPPTVAIAQPIPGDTFAHDATVLVRVEAADADGTVDSVELFVDDESRGAISNAPYRWELADLAPGSHRLVAVALDELGALTESSAVAITVRDVPNAS
ncbi:MAG: Ig-like domain-containing protein, partial [Pseudomonadota bacterium]